MNGMTRNGNEIQASRLKITNHFRSPRKRAGSGPKQRVVHEYPVGTTIKRPFVEWRRRIVMVCPAQRCCQSSGRYVARFQTPIETGQHERRRVGLLTRGGGFLREGVLRCRCHRSRLHPWFFPGRGSTPIRGCSCFRLRISKVLIQVMSPMGGDCRLKRLEPVSAM